MRGLLRGGGFRDIDDLSPAATYLPDERVELVTVTRAPFRWIQTRQPMMVMTAHAHFSRRELTDTILCSVFIFAANALWPASVSRYGFRRSSAGKGSIHPCCSNRVMAP